MICTSARRRNSCDRLAGSGLARTTSLCLVLVLIWQSGNFPRYAWKQVGDRVFEARLSNAGLGQYKGYPLEPHEAPGWLT